MALFNFTEVQKEAMLRVLGKTPDAPSPHQEVRESLKVDGHTVFFVDWALYLASVIDEYYSFLAQRLRNHPQVVESGRGL